MHAGSDNERPREPHTKDERPDREQDGSKGQYGGLDKLGPGGGEDFEDVKRPARPEDDRLPSRK